ncbi:MAG TPA: hypothetical protein VFW08_06125, partial [bacterium]|nr:hypothetical protein [bacterium]
MRSVRSMSIGLIASLLFTAMLAGAVRGDDDDEVEMTGVITAVSTPNASFQLREFSSNAVWSVILQRDAKIELKRGGRDKNYRLVSGDVVEVEGRRLATRTLLTKKVKVLAHTEGQPVSDRAPTFPQSGSPDRAPGLTVPAIVKTIGIGAAVKAFAPALNNFINRLVQAKDPTTLQ